MMKKLLFTFCGTLVSLFLLSSCEKWSVDSDAAAVTKDASDITSTKVVVSCLANVEPLYIDNDYGVMCSTDETKIKAHEGQLFFVPDIIKEKEYSVTLRGLLPNTVYYYCAVIRRLNNDWLYGKIKSFTTEDKIFDTNHEYVDLGLPSGTLWATMNVGAENPEDYGNYFSWGDTEPQLLEGNSYSWASYIYCVNNTFKLTKYCFEAERGYYGFTDALTELEESDDAASMNWGNGWCTPSKEQFEELINSNYTTIERTSLNGKKGEKITSIFNGNSIFLPAAGYCGGGSFGSANYFCFYWSRTLSLKKARTAWYWYDESDYEGMGCDYFCIGMNVRPVRNSE